MLIVNIGDLNAAFKSGDKVTPETLAAANLVQGHVRRTEDPRQRRSHEEAEDLRPRFSKTATEKITAAGGEAIVLPGKAPVVKGQKKVAKAGSKS